jgi:hypothetical protein
MGNTGRQIVEKMGNRQKNRTHRPSTIAPPSRWPEKLKRFEPNTIPPLPTGQKKLETGLPSVWYNLWNRYNAMAFV